MTWWLASLWGCSGGDPSTVLVPGESSCTQTADVPYCDGSTIVRCLDGFAEIEACGEAFTCDPASVTCVSCAVAIEVAHAVPGADVSLQIVPDPTEAFDPRRLRMRPITVTGSGTLQVEGPVSVYREDGTVLTSGDSVSPQTLLVQGDAPGIGRIEVVGCSTPAVVTFDVGARHLSFAGRSLSGDPGFEDPALFDLGTPVEAAVDGTALADRLGLPFDAVIVPHRDPASWAADPRLDPVAGPVSGTVGTLSAGGVVVSDRPLSPDDLVTAYDLVIDFGQDGTLDPGDLIDGFDTPGFYVATDLAEPGPHDTAPIEQVSVDFWHTMVVYQPILVDPIDPMPIVSISHGNGHDYDWYDYLGNHLASHGYVVFSHRNDTQPGTTTAATTTWENTDTFLSAVDSLGLTGEVDPTRIVWIGHSRGAEGVAIAKNWLHTGKAQPTGYTADDVVLVSSIAPVVFQSAANNHGNPHDAVYHQLIGSADGDVSGSISQPDLQWFRIFGRGTGEELLTYVQGADHNDFNCCGFNDSIFTQGPGILIGRPRAQAVAKSYYLALLESQLGDWPILGEYFVRAPARFRPPQANAVLATMHRRADGDRVWVVDDFESEPSVDRSSSGGLVTTTLTDLVEGELDDDNSQLSWNPSDPMNGMTWSSRQDATRDHGIAFGWNEGESHLLEFALPAGWQDLEDQGAISLRAAQTSRHPHTLALQDFASFSVALVDADGTTSAVDFGVYGGLPSPYPRHANGDGGGEGWVNEFQTIRVPIRAFGTVAPDLDLKQIVAIQLWFGADHGTPMGHIGLDDLEILEEGAR